MSVLCEEETEEDRTALVNCKNSVSESPETRSAGGSVGPQKPGLLVGQWVPGNQVSWWVSGSPETRSPRDSVVHKQYTTMCENDPLLHSLYYQYMF